MMFQSIGFNTLVQICSKIAIVVSGLFVMGLLTRKLGTAGYGNISMVYVGLGLAAAFTDFGLQLTGARELTSSRFSQREVFSSLFALKVLLAGAFLIVFSLFVLLSPYSEELKSLLWLSQLSLLALALVSPFQSLLQAKKAIGIFSICEAIGSLVIVFLVWWGMGGTITAGKAVLALIIGHGVFLLLAMLASRGGGFSIEAITFPVMKHLLIGAAILGVSGIAAIVISRLDILMLSWMSTMESVGIYGVAFRITEVVPLIPILYLAAAFPLFVEMLRGNKGQDTSEYQNAAEFLAFCTVPMLVGGFMLAPEICQLLTGTDYATSQSFTLPVVGDVVVEPVALAFRVLVIVAVLMAWGNLNGYLMIAGRKDRFLLRSYYIALPLNCVLNYFLIAKYSFFGAALASVITELVAIIYSCIVVKWLFGLNASLKQFWPAIFSVTPMVIFLHYSTFPIIVNIGIAGAVYLAAYCLIKPHLILNLFRNIQ